MLTHSPIRVRGMGLSVRAGSGWRGPAFVFPERRALEPEGCVSTDKKGATGSIHSETDRSGLARAAARQL
jgi:hypothetical protein